MDRRKFLQLIPPAIVAVVVAPKLLIQKETVKLLPLQEYKPRNLNSIIVYKSRQTGFSWISKAELDFVEDWKKQREIAWMQYNYSMIKNLSYIK